MFMVQLSVEGGHFTSAEKVGDDTRRVKYLRIALQLQGMCRKEPHLQSYFQGLFLHRIYIRMYLYYFSK